tara:strand:+ start:444 stop:716 length:273 start_codon:yes stop_codon:yes gene_type:complete
MVAGTRQVGNLRVGDLLGALPSSSPRKNSKTRSKKAVDRMAVSRVSKSGRKRTLRKLTMGSKKQRRTARQNKMASKLLSNVESLFSGFKL